MQIKLTQSCVTQGCVTQICAIFGNPICQCSSSYVFECLRVALYLFTFCTFCEKCRVALSLLHFSTGIEETAIYLSAICHNLPRHSYLLFAYALYNSNACAHIWLQRYNFFMDYANILCVFFAFSFIFVNYSTRFRLPVNFST